MSNLPVEPLVSAYNVASTGVSLQIGMNRPSLIVPFSIRRAWEAWVSEIDGGSWLWGLWLTDIVGSGFNGQGLSVHRLGSLTSQCCCREPSERVLNTFYDIHS